MSKTSPQNFEAWWMLQHAPKISMTYPTKFLDVLNLIHSVAKPGHCFSDPNLDYPKSNLNAKRNL